MTQEEIKNDLFLFYNDLYEYQQSIEGGKVRKAAKLYETIKTEETTKNLEEALNNFWNARNGAGLKWSSKKRREHARGLDLYIAELYREQN